MPAGERSAYFGGEHGWLATRTCARRDMAREPRRGPLIIQEFDSTILVPLEFSASVDAQSNVLMTRP
ncbi:MAG: hypothetical protein FJY54_07885 [Betaproteobacteria bacterium]|nr:hypothetical protein [Betaproteobacteria bacterium]